MEKSKRILIDTGDVLNEIKTISDEKFKKYIEMLNKYYSQENKKEGE